MNKKEDLIKKNDEIIKMLNQNIEEQFEKGDREEVDFYKILKTDFINGNTDKDLIDGLMKIRETAKEGEKKMSDNRFVKCNETIKMIEKDSLKIEQTLPTNGTIGGVEIEFYIYHTVEYVLENVLEKVFFKLCDREKIIKIVYEKVKDTYNNSDDTLTAEDEEEIVEILITGLISKEEVEEILEEEKKNENKV